jgi:hypothetical protein
MNVNIINNQLSKLYAYNCFINPLILYNYGNDTIFYDVNPLYKDKYIWSYGTPFFNISFLKLYKNDKVLLGNIKKFGKIFILAIFDHDFEISFKSTLQIIRLLAITHNHENIIFPKWLLDYKLIVEYIYSTIEKYIFVMYEDFFLRTNIHKIILNKQSYISLLAYKYNIVCFCPYDEKLSNYCKIVFDIQYINHKVDNIIHSNLHYLYSNISLYTSIDTTYKLTNSWIFKRYISSTLHMKKCTKNFTSIYVDYNVYINIYNLNKKIDNEVNYPNKNTLTLRFNDQMNISKFFYNNLTNILMFDKNNLFLKNNDDIIYRYKLQSSSSSQQLIKYSDPIVQLNIVFEQKIVLTYNGIIVFCLDNIYGLYVHNIKEYIHSLIQNIQHVEYFFSNIIKIKVHPSNQNNDVNFITIKQYICDNIDIYNNEIFFVIIDSSSIYMKCLQKGILCFSNIQNNDHLVFHILDAVENKFDNIFNIYCQNRKMILESLLQYYIKEYDILNTPILHLLKTKL